MAYTEADRVQIRKYLGFSFLFSQIHPQLESAITATQAIGSGGAAPDNSTEVYILSVITKLQSLDTKLEAQWDPMIAAQAGTKRIDAIRAVFGLRAEGRRLVGRLSAALNITPKRDPFMGPEFDPYQ